MATAAKKTTTNKTAATKKASTRKTAAKNTATKKAATKSKSVETAAETKKVATKKTAAKKTTAKTAAKPAAKKATTKKTATKKAAPKTAAKIATKKTAAKKASPKVTAKKTSVKKSESARGGVPPKSKAETPDKKSTQANKDKDSTVSTVDAQKPESQKIAAARRPTRRQPFRKKGLENVTFKVNEQIVYPAHGVGKVIAKEKQSIADMEIELYVIDFEHEKMKLRVPTNRAYESGMRPLSTDEEVDHALSLLQGRARIKRTMWSRRAQEYEAKINSGDLRSVAEVVRDLYRASDQPEQSYSERQLYEQAVDRMAREVAAVRKCDQLAAVAEMEESLQKKAVAA